MISSPSALFSRHRMFSPVWFVAVFVLAWGTSWLSCSPITPGSDGAISESTQESVSSEALNESAAESNTEPNADTSGETTVSESTGDSSSSETATESPSSTEGTSDAAEATPESPAVDCVLSCGDVRSRCLDKDRVERCIAQVGCVVWKTETCGGGKECKAGDCVAKTCNGPGECGTGFHCKDGTCQSNDTCCKEGARECTNNASRQCEKGVDQCGQWSQAQACPSGQGCDKGACSVCRHRPCQGPADCCSGTTCSYGYCLVHCSTAQGEINNPNCATDEYCFELQPGSQALCFVDFTEPKGAECSIIKMCQFGLSCVKVSTDYRCHTDCNPAKGTAGNPDCAKNEQCAGAPGSSLGGVCIPFQGQSRKLHEACDASNPCSAPNLCVGQSAGSTYCLAPCNPQQSPTTCPTTDLCAGYDPGDGTKGICVQRCSIAGTKDICSYGLCRSQNNETICF